VQIARFVDSFFNFITEAVGGPLRTTEIPGQSDLNGRGRMSICLVAHRHRLDWFKTTNLTQMNADERR
jgi:hypothetical protein